MSSLTTSFPILKNPLLVGFIVSAIVFAIMHYYYDVPKKTGNKKDDKKNESMITGNASKKEVVIVSSAIAGLFTWFVITQYTKKEKLSSDSLPVVELVQPSTGTHNIKTGDNVPITSENVKTIEQIDVGLNIPKSDIKIPPVLIDYQ
jgi:hypothetical protein